MECEVQFRETKDDVWTRSQAWDESSFVSTVGKHIREIPFFQEFRVVQDSFAYRRVPKDPLIRALMEAQKG